MYSIKSMIVARAEIEHCTGVSFENCGYIYSHISGARQHYFPVDISPENITACYNAMDEVESEKKIEELNNSITIMEKLKELYPDYEWIMVMNY